jgi:hypothetical protein
MTTISGFTFIHNALHGGYPIVEAIAAVRPYVGEIVVVDMESDDGTRELLENLDVRILDGYWEPGYPGRCLANAHALHKQCAGDVIVHFEADEVFSRRLIDACIWYVRDYDALNLSVWRLQVEQNFQRIRWYPELVHRVFPRLAGTIKQGHTTNHHGNAAGVHPAYGFLWDVTNCFRDNWRGRVEQQAELWGSTPSLLIVPLHAKHALFPDSVDEFLAQPHWTWRATPLDIPDILKPLVGKTRYEPDVQKS